LQTKQLHGAVFGAARLRGIQPSTGALDSILKLSPAPRDVVELQAANAHGSAEEVSVLDGRPRDSSCRVWPVASFALGRRDIEHDGIQSPRSRDVARS